MDLGFVVAVSSVLVGVANLGLLWYLQNLGDRPGLTWFQGVIAAQAVFCATYGGGLLLGSSPLRVPLLMAYWLAAIWIGVAYLGFALVYTGRARYVRSRPFLGVVAVQAIASVVVLTYPLNDFGPTQVEPVPYGGVVVLEYLHSPFVFFEFFVVAALATFGVALLIDTVLSYGPLYRKHAFAIAITPVAPTVAYVAWLFELAPLYPLNLTALAFFPHLALDLYALFGEDMFEFPPATRRRAERAAVEDLGNPVVVVDPDDRIVRLNAAAVDAFDVTEASALTTTIDEYLVPVDDGFDGDHVRVRDDPRNRVYARTRNELDDGAGRPVGYTLVLQDVTAEITREQRVGVLNRVLRHNLRNDLTVVLGNVTAAADATDDDQVASFLKTAAEQTRDLSALGERAREVDATMSAAVSTTTVVDAASILDEIAADLAVASSDDTVDVDVPTDCRVTGDPDVFRVVFENLVDNALVHHDGNATVAIHVDDDHAGCAGNSSIDFDADTVTLIVEDDGPGIPPHERAVLDGRESSLDHGSGLGLWVVNWGVRTLGGDLTFETPADGGTHVRVTLPAA